MCGKIALTRVPFFATLRGRSFAMVLGKRCAALRTLRYIANANELSVKEP